MWRAYADPGLWKSWAPQIRRVHADGPLRPGMEGQVDGLLGLRARFRVTEVDESAGTWSWEVRVGPARLRIDHEVDEGSAAVDIVGSPVVVAGYAPVARLALERLVRLK